ncbi:hypothetical protein [Methylobacterium brachythecii]|nr:hypothetical protein [Methylobacterium brachythecii]
MASMRRTRSSRAVSHRSRALRAMLLGAAALSLVAASEASAQFYGYVGTYRGPIDEDDMAPMPPRAVVYRLQDRGFSEISRPRFDGRAYVVEATNPAGHRVRLYVDAGDGSIFGRQRIDAPPNRVARAAPGYGWTNDEPAMRRGRDQEALLPPGDIPLPRPSLHSESERAPTIASRPGATDPNTYGVNPDARSGAKPDARKADKAQQRKTAKLTPPSKPAAPRIAPEAPVPTVAPVEQAAPNAGATPEPAKVPDVVKAPDAVKAPAELPKAETAPLLPAAKLPVNEEKAAEKPAEPAPADKPAAPQATEKPAEAPAKAAEKPAEAPAAPQAVDKPVAEKPAEAPKPESKEAANQKWQDPPSGDAKRKVRIIGGTSTAPGAPSNDAVSPAAN